MIPNELTCLQHLPEVSLGPDFDSGIAIISLRDDTTNRKYQASRKFREKNKKGGITKDSYIYPFIIISSVENHLIFFRKRKSWKIIYIPIFHLNYVWIGARVDCFIVPKRHARVTGSSFLSWISSWPREVSNAAGMRVFTLHPRKLT